MDTKKGFEVGDKVILIEKELKDCGIENTRIREGVITRLSEVPTLIYVKRGSNVESWHTAFWEKKKPKRMIRRD